MQGGGGGGGEKWEVKGGNIKHGCVGPEPVFVNVYGAQESITPAYVTWRTGTVVVPAPLGWESTPELLKTLTKTGSWVVLGC